MGGPNMTDTDADPDAESETVTTEKTVWYNGSEVMVTVEVETSEYVDADEAEPLADVVVEEGTSTDYVSWDDEHPVPTRGNRSI